MAGPALDGSGPQKRRHVVAIVLVAALLLIGGGTGAYFYFTHTPEEVAACRIFAQGGLRSPATYAEARQRIYTNSATETELRRDYFAGDLDELDRLSLERVRGHDLSIRTVFLEYDASNAFGTPVRGLTGCAFLLIDGAIDGSGSLESRARAAASDRDMAALAEQLNNQDLRRLARRREMRLPCCIR